MPALLGTPRPAGALRRPLLPGGRPGPFRPGPPAALAPGTLRRLAIALTLTGLLGGCAAPGLRPDALPDPALAAIQDAFERAVAAAHDDLEVDWQSGWTGNAMINLLGGARQGLCYQWRDLVYAGVLPSVRAVGWEATGIVMSKGTYSEHSAVLVFDPRRVSASEVLGAPRDQPVYVLDAWRRGRADIYPLHDWLRLPIIVRSPAELKALAEPVPTPAPMPAAPTAGAQPPGPGRAPPTPGLP